MTICAQIGHFDRMPGSIETPCPTGHFLISSFGRLAILIKEAHLSKVAEGVVSISIRSIAFFGESWFAVYSKISCFYLPPKLVIFNIDTRIAKVGQRWRRSISEEECPFFSAQFVVIIPGDACISPLRQDRLTRDIEELFVHNMTVILVILESFNSIATLVKRGFAILVDPGYFNRTVGVVVLCVPSGSAIRSDGRRT